MKPGPGPWWSRRYGRIRCQWPTCLPGIRFCATGTLTYRASVPIKSSGSAAVGAAARLALDELARGITQAHPPEQLDTAQEELMLAAAQWHEAKDNPGLWLKARIALTLSERDAVRAQRYEDALRDVTLHLELEQERRRQFRAAVLVDPDAARIWWLERHLDDVSSLDWGVFREKVLPLVGAADDMQSRAERMARTFLYVWEKLGNDPGQHARFAATAKTVLEQMGWADAAPWLLSSEPVATVDPSGTSSDDAGKRRLTTEASAGR